MAFCVLQKIRILIKHFCKDDNITITITLFDLKRTKIVFNEICKCFTFFLDTCFFGFFGANNLIRSLAAREQKVNDVTSCSCTDKM